MSKTYVLSSIAQEHYGPIMNIDEDSVSFTKSFNEADEISFDVYKELNGVKEPLWDKITPLKLVYVPEETMMYMPSEQLENFSKGTYYQIDVAEEETEDTVKKTVTGKSLCESELSQVILYDLEINNENDRYWIEAKNNNKKSEDYPSTVFYNPAVTSTSLLHRILDKAPHYSIGHVDSTLCNLQRSFSANGTSIYDFLSGDVAEAFNCLFVFDSVKREINAYDLLTVCITPQADGSICGTRKEYGKFYNQETKTCTCPKCGATGSDLKLQIFGQETTVYFDVNNMTDSISFSTNTDEIKNCFKMTAGDDIMTAAVTGQNPNGSAYIYYFDSTTMNDMPEELQESIKAYNAEYDKYQTQDYSLNKDLVDKYNALVDKYNSPYGGNEIGIYEYLTKNELSKITDPVSGYSGLTNLLYDVSDFSVFLESSMMPVDKVNFVDASTEALKVVPSTGVLDSVSIEDLTTISEFKVENAIKLLVKAYVLSGYVDIEIETTSLVDDTWTGVIKFTNNSKEDDIVYVYADGINTDGEVAKKSPMTIQVTDSYEDYLQQKIVKQLQEETENKTSYEILSTNDLDAFNAKIIYYSRNRLQSFVETIGNVLAVLSAANQGEPGAEFYNEFYLLYQTKLATINQVLTDRETELAVLYSDNSEDDCLYNEILNIQSQVKSALSLSNYLGEDLYKVFCAYRREDEYENSNFISDSLTNAQLMTRAAEFIEDAEIELMKAGTPQHTISTSLYNIYSMDEFAGIRKNMRLGNWIRCRVDDDIYRLRLVSIGGKDESDQTINVEFSDVTVAPGVMTDIKSVLSSAQSMASSYSSVAKQASDGDKVSTQVNSFMEDGLNSALISLYSGNQKTLEFTKQGLLGRDYDDISDTYSDEQMLLTNNMLAFTEDNWQTASLGLGKHDYKYYNVDEELTTGTGYGAVLNKVKTGFIQGGVNVCL